jgi:aromatic-amino-acid transaminase
MSLFQSVPLAPPDPIFGIETAFRADPRPHKLNLAIGVYREAGATYLFDAVRRAEQQLVEMARPKDYLPIDGDARYLELLAELVLPGHQTVSACQTVGGTGALRLVADFLMASGFKQIHLPQPTWANHTQLFGRVGLQLVTYPYYALEKHQLLAEPMCSALSSAEGVVLFHASCHNPTGADPSPEEWQALAETCRKQRLFPLFDLAYQGFGAGLEQDREALKIFAAEGLEFAVAVSCAKNMGLYGERAGALLFSLHQAETAQRISSQLRSLVRTNYSNPPRHGAAIARTVLETPDLKRLWHAELEQIRLHLRDVRCKLAEALQLPVVATQNGLFSCLGLSTAQVEQLRNEQAIYLGPFGRINMAGLPLERLQEVASHLSSYAS